MKGVILDHYLSTFKETSYDKTNNVSLMKDYQKRIINFDEFTTSLCGKYRGENLSSADALAVSNNDILLIEFKNQKLSHVDSRVIQKKAFDSPYILSFLAGQESVNWARFSSRVIFIVLYREDDIPSWTKFQNQLQTLSGKKNPSFGLSKFNEFYKSIYTMTSKEFENSEMYKNIK